MRALRLMHLLSLAFLSIPCMAQPQSDIKTIQEVVDQALRPHLTAMERRPEQDQIIHQGDEIEIWRLDSFERGEVDLKLCQAASDLIYGRTPKSEGIQYLFNALPHINAVELKFYREKTSVSPDLNGSYQQTKTTVLTVSLRLDRARASQLKLDSIRDIFQGSACVQRARQFFDEIWLSEEIQSRRDQLQRIALERKARGLSAAPVVQQ